jgi:hypothetical protein
MSNKTLHRTAIPLRSIAAGELLRSAACLKLSECNRAMHPYRRRERDDL